MVNGESKTYQDRLYINEGSGQLSAGFEWLPKIPTSGSVVAAHDYDSDGDLDLFVGGRHVPGEYPKPPRSYLLHNSSSGFNDVTQEIAPDLTEMGMVTSAVWADLHVSPGLELVVAGEWMPIRVFAVDNNHTFTEVTTTLGLDNSHGFWNVIVAEDIDLDGDIDLVGGNRGLNTQLKVDSESPASIYGGDFDHSGTWDLVMGMFIKGFDAPLASRDQIIQQLPKVAEEFGTYASYATAGTRDLVPDQMEALNLKATVTESSVFRQNADGRFTRYPLPLMAQVAPVRSIYAGYLNEDRFPRFDIGG